MAKKAINPVLEGIIMSMITTLSEAGAEMLWQKMVDKDKAKATIVLRTLSQSINAVVKANKIKL
jgi:hypothetical protein